MKKILNILLAFTLFIGTSCTYTFPEEEALTSGNANFTKVVAVGNSLTAGFMNGALYNDGQNNSYASIIATQMKEVGGGSFNQPDINAEFGDYGSSNGVYGRLHLVIPPGGSLSDAVPMPYVPGNAITAYSGDKSALNNFGVPGMRIVDAGVSGYGSLNPYFGRFESAANASVLGDAAAANGSFVIFWLGSNDVLGYAINGATGNTEGDGTNPGDMTQKSIFEAAYSGAITTLFANGQKGIVANIPNVQDIPYFTTVTWDAIVLDNPDQIAALNNGYAAYNSTLDALVDQGVNDPNQFPGFTQEEANSRKIVFANGANGIVILDETLTDLTVVDPSLVSMRMADSDDLITLVAGAVLPSGVCASSPLGDEYTLTHAEQETIADRIAEFNAAIAAQVSASNGNIALLDINQAFSEFTFEGAVINGAAMDATIYPPYGAFSLDGIHPNARGSAYVAGLFIEKINESFGSNIPGVNPNNYSGNELPVPQ